MNQSLVLGLFAFAIAGISFLRLLGDREFFRVTAMKRTWGRVRGLALHFVTNVAAPMVVGIVFFAHGVAVFAVASTPTPTSAEFTVVLERLQDAAQGPWYRTAGYKAAVVEYWHWGEFAQL